ncbi:response regulator [Acidobacteria bacterium AB60]|nr:response regulator [Acidobacteria bacterium AB60]
MTGAKPKCRVLVIDDERLIADTLTEILTLHGLDATPLYSGESALEWIESYRPDIVLSDISMHRVDGIQAAERIRSLHPECRVILFSASAQNAANRRKIRDLGFEYLERPLHPKDLLARVMGSFAPTNLREFQKPKAS